MSALQKNVSIASGGLGATLQVKTILVTMVTKILELATKLQPKSPKIEKEDWKCELNLATKMFHWRPNLSSRWPTGH